MICQRIFIKAKNQIKSVQKTLLVIIFKEMLSNFKDVICKHKRQINVNLSFRNILIKKTDISLYGKWKSSSSKTKLTQAYWNADRWRVQVYCNPYHTWHDLTWKEVLQTNIFTGFITGQTLNSCVSWLATAFIYLY